MRDGDEFVIDGQKIWTSFGETADYCYLICRTSTEGPPHAGICEIIVPLDSPGITIRPIKDMTTNRHFCEVFYDDVRVPAANLVGEEGGSFKQTMRQLEHERGGIDRLLSNRALYHDGPPRGRHERPARPPEDRPRSRPATASAACSCCARCWGRRRRSFSAATKTFCTEHEQRVADFVARVVGRRRDAVGTARAGVQLRPRATRSWAAPRTCCATSSASGCWAFPGNPEHPPRGVAEV